MYFCFAEFPPFSPKKIHRSKNIHRFNRVQIWLILNRCIFFSIDVFFSSKMAGSRYDRTTNIKRSNIHQDSQACLPDLLITKERKTWSQWRQVTSGSDPITLPTLASLKLARIRKWRGGTHILFFGGKRQQTDGIWEKYIDQIHRFIHQF